MLRTLGIPSRVVNGFRTGEFNDLTSQYLVRASNAHSWVEAYFPGYGWISFDPTPAAPPPSHSGWGRALLYVDAMASFWREWVINYDRAIRHALGREATQSSLEWLHDLRYWSRSEYDAVTKRRQAFAGDNLRLAARTGAWERCALPSCLFRQLMRGAYGGRFKAAS